MLGETFMLDRKDVISFKTMKQFMSRQIQGRPHAVTPLNEKDNYSFTSIPYPMRGRMWYSSSELSEEGNRYGVCALFKSHKPYALLQGCFAYFEYIEEHDWIQIYKLDDTSFPYYHKSTPLMYNGLSIISCALMDIFDQESRPNAYMDSQKCLRRKLKEVAPAKEN
jgi:hypothetical protein